MTGRAAEFRAPKSLLCAKISGEPKSECQNQFLSPLFRESAIRHSEGACAACLALQPGAKIASFGSRQRISLLLLKELAVEWVESTCSTMRWPAATPAPGRVCQRIRDGGHASARRRAPSTTSGRVTASSLTLRREGHTPPPFLLFSQVRGFDHRSARRPDANPE